MPANMGLPAEAGASAHMPVSPAHEVVPDVDDRPVLSRASYGQYVADTRTELWGQLFERQPAHERDDHLSHSPQSPIPGFVTDVNELEHRSLVLKGDVGESQGAMSGQSLAKRPLGDALLSTTPGEPNDQAESEEIAEHARMAAARIFAPPDEPDGQTKNEEVVEHAQQETVACEPEVMERASSELRSLCCVP
jgi:hypothetical protein